MEKEEYDRMVTETSPESWKAVGKYLRQATVEVAQSMGGQDLAMEAINLAGNPENVIPNPASLAFLEMQFPGSAEAIMLRSERIQQDQFEQDRLKVGKGNFVSRFFRRG